MTEEQKQRQAEESDMWPERKQMFNSPEKQLALIREYNDKFKFGFTDKHFKAVDQLPIQPDTELTTTVLVPYFSSLEKTWDSLWEAIEQTYEKTWANSNIKGNVSLHSGKHPKKQLKWVTLDLNTHRDDTVKQARDKSADPTRYEVGSYLAGVEVLACALLHPDWVKSMNGDDVPYIDIGNIEVVGAWSGFPYLYWWQDVRELSLRVDFVGYLRRSYAAPRVRECSFGPQTLEPRQSLEIGTSDLADNTKALRELNETLKKVFRV